MHSIRCRNLGIKRYLVKPVREQELRDVMLHALGITPQDGLMPGGRGIASGMPFLGKRILLVEDNPTNQKLAVLLLNKRGHSVVVAADGLQAVQEFQRDRFDAVLMDIQMPQLGGFEATSAIRAIETPEGRRTPIIALTAHAMKGDRERCLEVGMDDYLSKPIRAQDLFAKIEQWARIPDEIVPLENDAFHPFGSLR
ncbi:MAG: response regulator [Bryobacteraceae bacterium]